MYLLKPKGFWGNLETGLPPELRNVQPSQPDQRVVDKITSEFVQLKPGAEALKNWTGINLRFIDPGEYQLWQQDQREKDLKADVGKEGRFRDVAVDEALAAYKASGTPAPSRAYLNAIYDSTLKEQSRHASAAVRSYEKDMVTGKVDEKTAMAAAAYLVGRDKEAQVEVVGILLRDAPAEQNIEDAKVLMRQRLVDALRARAHKDVLRPTGADLVGTARAKQ